MTPNIDFFRVAAIPKAKVSEDSAYLGHQSAPAGNDQAATRASGPFKEASGVCVCSIAGI